MTILFDQMTQAQAEAIAYHWQYEGVYSFYNMESDPDDLVEFLNPEKRGNSFVVAHMGGEIIGFFGFTQMKDDSIDMALGMKPSLTGKGLGRAFMQAGIAFALTTYRPGKIVLAVATFNQRAIHLYRNVGFTEVKTFNQETNGSIYEFLEMAYTPTDSNSEISES